MEKDALPIIESYSVMKALWNIRTFILFIYTLISESIKFYIIFKSTNIILSDVFNILFITTIEIKFNLKLYILYIYVHIIYVWIITSKCKHVFSINYWNENLKNI